MQEFHRDALERTIEGGPVLAKDEHAALVALCRSLADQMDDAEHDDGPSTRLSAAYLSALKDVRRVLADASSAPREGGKLAVLQGELPGSVKRNRRRA